MDMETRVYVINDLDVMLARVQARQIAQKLGFNSADQARISLATSELARLLSWEAFQPGELTIAKDGNVRDVKVLRRLPMGLTEAAVAAVEQWRYQPATLAGEPIDIIYIESVRFLPP